MPTVRHTILLCQIAEDSLGPPTDWEVEVIYSHEKLRTICIFSSVGHRQQELFTMLFYEVLICQRKKPFTYFYFS